MVPSTAGAVELFLTSRKAAGCRPKTVAWYRYTLGHLIRTAQSLPTTPEPLEQLLAQLQQRVDTHHFADHSAYDIFAALRVFYTWASDRLGVPNVMLHLKRKRPTRRDLRTLSALEVQHLLWANAPSRRVAQRERALLLLLLDTGARIGEVHNLSWRDIIDDDDGPAVRLNGKTGERTVPVSTNTFYELQELQRTTGALWHGRRGPLSLSGLQHAVQRAMRRAGLQGGPHYLRHTFGRLYIVNSGSVFGLQRILGHSQIATTRKYVDMDLRDVRAEHRRASPVAGERLSHGRQLRLVASNDHA